MILPTAQPMRKATGSYWAYKIASCFSVDTICHVVSKYKRSRIFDMKIRDLFFGCLQVAYFSISFLFFKKN